MASYAEAVRFVGIIDRGLARFGTLQALYLKAIDGELSKTFLLLSKTEPAILKRVFKKTTWQERAIELGKLGLLEPVIAALIDRLKKANEKIAEWQKAKTLHLKGLNVSAGHGFAVRVLSISHKGMMVTIKHANMKHPVTRHLQKKGNVYTGKAPFGAESFIEYHVSILGEIKNHPSGIDFVPMDERKDSFADAA